MRRACNVVFGVAACLVVGAAGTQDVPTPTARPSAVGDAIAKIIKETPVPSPPVQGAAASAANPAKEPIVMGARIGEHRDRTRFVVELSDPVDIRSFTLSNPNRVVIDMPAVQWHLEGPPQPSGYGAVKSYRYGLFRPGNSRFVIDLNQPVIMSDTLVLPPENGHGYRVVIDLFPTTQAKFNRTAGWPADLKAKEYAAEQAAVQPPPTVSPQVPAKKIVVVDPGHGGIDSGTVGVGGTMEKDVVLAEGLRLRNALQARGYTVFMTRENDVFVPLRQRVNFARAHRADLLVSIHADSSPNPDAAGLTIYTLSEKGSDREAAALAQKENQSDVIAGVDLSGDNSTVAPILIDLAQRDTMNKSSYFAQTALATLSHAADIMPHRPHRSAALVVLKAPDVPAVLIELGYLSNIHDAERMKTVAWRDNVANAIAKAVDLHFATAASAERGATQGMQ